jgi:hypothetical protein
MSRPSKALKEVLLMLARRLRRFLRLALEKPLTLLALFLSVVYSVPSVWRVVLYILGFVGPPILFATGSLTLASGLAWRSLRLQLITAFAGSMIGLAVGFAVVVYVLGVW